MLGLLLFLTSFLSDWRKRAKRQPKSLTCFPYFSYFTSESLSGSGLSSTIVPDWLTHDTIHYTNTILSNNLETTASTQLPRLSYSFLVFLSLFSSYPCFHFITASITGSELALRGFQNTWKEMRVNLLFRHSSPSYLPRRGRQLKEKSRDNYLTDQIFCFLFLSQPRQSLNPSSPSLGQGVVLYLVPVDEQNQSL